MIRLGPIRLLLLAQASIAQRWQDMKAEGMFEVQRLADQSKAALNYFEANPSACSSCNELAAHLGDADYDKMWSWMVDSCSGCTMNIIICIQYEQNIFMMNILIVVLVPLSSVFNII